MHALIGENGAGKTVLRKFSPGPCSGFRGNSDRLKRLPSIHQVAQDLVAMIYQELRLFPDLNIIQNIFIKENP